MTIEFQANLYRCPHCNITAPEQEWAEEYNGDLGCGECGEDVEFVDAQGTETV